MLSPGRPENRCRIGAGSTPAPLRRAKIGGMSKQPNFLFILSDQLRRDRTGFGGNPVVKPPTSTT